jgi:riboflavin synthase
VFTGIVEELGRLAARQGSRFSFEASAVLEDLKIGDSIAHNGCCLTVVEIGQQSYGVDVVAESLARTNLGDLQPGDPVNLERPVRMSDRLGGHLVQGHVDAVGVIARPAPDLEVTAPGEVLRYLVEKGSVTVDGCSLTVVSVRTGSFTVAVIPHTASVTTLGSKSTGDRVNLEVDVVAKYVERLLSPAIS